MKMITNYEVAGCWINKKNVGKFGHECAKCGATYELVPREDHYNSQYWELERNDGQALVCCPHGCSAKLADKNMKFFSLFNAYMKEGSEPYFFEWDWKKIDSCWITDKGEFYPCRYEGHSRLLDTLNDRGFIKFYLGTDAEKGGWMKVSGGEFFNINHYSEKCINTALEVLTFMKESGTLDEDFDKIKRQLEEN